MLVAVWALAACCDDVAEEHFGKGAGAGPPERGRAGQGYPRRAGLEETARGKASSNGATQQPGQSGGGRAQLRICAGPLGLGSVGSAWGRSPPRRLPRPRRRATPASPPSTSTTLGLKMIPQSSSTMISSPGICAINGTTSIKCPWQTLLPSPRTCTAERRLWS